MSQEPPTTPVDPSVPAVEDQEVGIIADYEGLPSWLKLGVLALIVVVLAVIFAIWHDFYFHWFEVHTGTVQESGPYYGFWSGFGSDIGEATLIVGVGAAWRHHNCHVKGCARLGRPVAGTPYIACPKHHPEHQGYKRGVSRETIHGAHLKARKDRKKSDE
jgi:hypothetical protein